jgi:hypothetical protein
MHCQLLVPDLFWPERDERDIYRELEVPALLQLLAKGRRERSAARSAETWLGGQFGLEAQADWPVAAYSLLADGGEPGTHHWLRADPVHLRAESGRLVLADSGTFGISQQEAERFTDSLNQHFEADGLFFYPLRPDRWYLRTHAAPALQTTPLAEAAGKSVDALLPRGADSLAWRNRLNEAQMLLHAHPANAAREEAGQMPVNSVWVWGGGSIQETVSSHFTSVWATDAFAAGLARAAHVLAPGLPADTGVLLAAAPGEGVSLVLLDQLRAAAQYADGYGWRETLLRMERDWFAPLLDALRQERVGMLTVHALGPGGTLSVESARGDLRRFWRRAKPLSSHA